MKGKDQSAPLVWVHPSSLGEEDEYLHLLISDDGHGIDAGQGGKGMGMQIMKYRVQVIGAFLDIVSNRDEGTTLHIFMKKSEMMHHEQQT